MPKKNEKILITPEIAKILAERRAEIAEGRGELISMEELLKRAAAKRKKSPKAPGA